MSELELTEQLNQAIDAMIATGELPSGVDEQVAGLLGVAVELRQLPRAEFRERLRREMENEAMSATQSAVESTPREMLAREPRPPAHSKINPVREGFRTITPYLVVPDVHAEAEFLRQAFGVTGQIHGLGSQGGFHAEYNIGGSMIMVGGGGAGSQWKGTPLPGALHLYVEDVDAVYARAVQAGATSLYAPMEQPVPDRRPAKLYEIVLVRP